MEILTGRGRPPQGDAMGKITVSRSSSWRTMRRNWRTGQSVVTGVRWGHARWESWHILELLGAHWHAWLTATIDPTSGQPDDEQGGGGRREACRFLIFPSLLLCVAGSQRIGTSEFRARGSCRTGRRVACVVAGSASEMQHTRRERASSKSPASPLFDFF